MDFLNQIFQRFALIRFRRFLGSLLYPLQRDWLERQSSSSPTPSPPQEPGELIQAQATGRGATFTFAAADLEIELLTPDLVRVHWQPGLKPLPYGVVCREWPVLEVNLEQQQDQWILRSPGLVVTVGVQGQVEFHDTAGKVLRSHLPPQRQGETWSDRATLQPQERCYGLGERAAPFNLRTPRQVKKGGKPIGTSCTYQFWNADRAGEYGPGDDPLYLCIPTYLGLHQQGSYLVFYENMFPGNITFNEMATVSFEAGALRYYFTAGTPAQVLDRYTELTGRPPLPPYWTLGYHQSRWGYYTEANVRKTAQAFQDHDLPLSAIHLDIDTQQRFRAFTIDPNRFPGLAEFNQELSERGVRLIAIVSPGIKADPTNKLFQEGKLQEVFCRRSNGEIVTAPVWPGMSAFPDYTNPLARHWWSRQYEYLLDLGVTGFWHDMNEPAVLVLWGDRTLPARSTRHYLDGRGGDHREAHNVYGLLQALAGYESLREYCPEQRPYIVSRAGWAGLQRYAWTWTGDIETSWPALRQTVSTVLGLGLSGIPYSGSDIGGFKGNPSAELYLRWFQMASFHPFFRTHSANNTKHRQPWSFGEQVLQIARDFLKLRYSLLSYFYTLAWEATQSGHPLVRPLFWADSQDSALWEIDDAFLVGDALLICPVVEQGARTRPAQLPRGSWYNFWSDQILAGPAEVTLEAPLERMPILVKAGSILPMQAENLLILHLYAPPVGETDRAILYSDAGDGYGDWRLEQFDLSRDEHNLELTWSDQGDYSFPYEGVSICLHGFESQQAWVDGTPMPVKENRLEVGRFQTVRFQPC